MFFPWDAQILYSGELDQNWLNLCGMIMHGSQQVYLALCT